MKKIIFFLFSIYSLPSFSSGDTSPTVIYYASFESVNARKAYFKDSFESNVSLDVFDGSTPNELAANARAYYSSNPLNLVMDTNSSVGATRTITSCSSTTTRLTCYFKKSNAVYFEVTTIVPEPVPDCSLDEGDDGKSLMSIPDGNPPSLIGLEGCEYQVIEQPIYFDSSESNSPGYAVRVQKTGLPFSDTDTPVSPISDNDMPIYADSPDTSEMVVDPTETVSSGSTVTTTEENTFTTSTGLKVTITKNEDGTVSYSDYKGTNTSEKKTTVTETNSDGSKTVTETTVNSNETGGVEKENYQPSGQYINNTTINSTGGSSTTVFVTNYDSSGNVTGTNSSTTVDDSGSGSDSGSDSGSGSGLGGDGTVTVDNLGTLETNTADTVGKLGEINDKLDGLTEDAGTFDDLSGSIEGSLEGTGLTELSDSMTHDDGSQGVYFTSTIAETFTSLFPQSPSCTDLNIPILDTGQSIVFKCSDTQGIRSILYWLFSLMTIYYLYSLFVTSNKKD